MKLTRLIDVPKWYAWATRIWFDVLGPPPPNFLRPSRLLTQTPPADPVTRPPVTWLTYQGDCRGRVGCLVGPNHLGETMHVARETYESDSDTTIVGFAYGRPPTST